MFDIGSSELLLIIIVAVVVIGPKDLPRALYKLGQFVGKGRAMARHFRTGFDAMVREAEVEELQKQWAKDNARIMALHPTGDEGLTAPDLIDHMPSPSAALPAPDAPMASAHPPAKPKRARKPQAKPSAKPDDAA